VINLTDGEPLRHYNYRRKNDIIKTFS
jgi:hypothetical protein